MTEDREDLTIKSKLVLLGILLIVVFLLKNPFCTVSRKENVLCEASNFIKQEHNISYALDTMDSYWNFDNKYVTSKQGYNLITNEVFNGSSILSNQYKESLCLFKMGEKCKIAEQVDGYEVSLSGDSILYFQQSGPNFPDNVIGA